MMACACDSSALEAKAGGLRVWGQGDQPWGWGEVGWGGATLSAFKLVKNDTKLSASNSCLKDFLQ